MDDYLPVILASSLFSDIEAKEAAAMLSCLDARTRQFDKGSFVLRAGDATGSLGIVLSGRALIVQEDFWGNRNIVSPVEPGQLFAEAFACAPRSIMNVSVVAQTPCAILFLNVEKLLRTCPSTCPRHDKAIRNLLSSLAAKNLEQTEKLSHLGQRTTRAKLLSYLSATAQRCGSFEFDIPFTRQQLADYLSVDRSGLSLELGKMRDEGMLDFRKNHFVLHRQP